MSAVGGREEPRAGRSGRGSPRRSSRRRAHARAEPAARRPARARARRAARRPRAGSPRPRRRRARPRGQLAEDVRNGLDGPVHVLVGVRERDEQALELRRRDVDPALEQAAEEERRSARCRRARRRRSSGRSRPPSGTASPSRRLAGRCRTSRRPSSSRAPSCFEPLVDGVVAQPPQHGDPGGGGERVPGERAGLVDVDRPARGGPCTSARPPNAASGSPPPTILPRMVRSGRTPKRSCAPPRATRKPVITSSKTSSAPLASQSRRSASRNPGSGGTTPMFPATGSTTIAASPSP